MANIKIENSGDRIIASLPDYSALIVSEKVHDHPELEMYAAVLLHWAIEVWDWESTVTLTENRAEKLEISGNQVCYSLSNEDLIGLCGGKYGESPGPITGFLDENGKISDTWADIQAYCYTPKTRFATEVIKELENEI
jgi:hypothetical protein